MTPYIIIEEFADIAEIFSHSDTTICANLSNLQKKQIKSKFTDRHISKPLTTRSDSSFHNNPNINKLCVVENKFLARFPKSMMSELSNIHQDFKILIFFI